EEDRSSFRGIERRSFSPTLPQDDFTCSAPSLKPITDKRSRAFLPLSSSRSAFSADTRLSLNNRPGAFPHSRLPASASVKGTFDSGLSPGFALRRELLVHQSRLRDLHE